MALTPAATAKCPASKIRAQGLIREENSAGKDLFHAERSTLATSLDPKKEGPGWEQVGVEIISGGSSKSNKPCKLKIVVTDFEPVYFSIRLGTPRYVKKVTSEWL
jgi:hypothetical protein